nr:hypothetical protein LTR18_007683 [Exophiala xenobiotica]
MSYFEASAKQRSLVPLYLWYAAFIAIPYSLIIATPALLVVWDVVFPTKEPEESDHYSTVEHGIHEYDETIGPAISEGLKWRRLENFDNFRLLTIDPGTGGTIHCSLREYPLGNSPPYEAISYSWKTAAGEAMISCDDVDIPVSQSLYNALNAIRQTGRSRTVWVDAVCINQDDIEERSVQVQAIGRIFSGADLVWIHLGEACAKTSGALDIIEKTIGTGRLSDQTENLEPVLNLLERSWFERLWVIQEVCVAKQAVVVHGSDWIYWQDMASFCAKMHSSVDRTPLGSFRSAENVAKVVCIEEIRRRFRDKSKRDFLLDLVMMTSKFKVTDPRDKIFALVGLAKDVTDADWEVRPLDLAKRGDMRMLSYGKDPEFTSAYSLPSWVPDLSVSDQSRSPAMLAISDEPSNPRDYVISEVNDAGFIVEPLLQASYHLQTPKKHFLGMQRFSFSGNNKIMHLKGKEVDRLESVSRPGHVHLAGEDAGLIFCLESYRQWKKEEADRLCQIIFANLSEQASWLQETWQIAQESRQRSLDVSIDDNKDLWWLTLTCGRLSTGLPAPETTRKQFLERIYAVSPATLPADYAEMATFWDIVQRLMNRTHSDDSDKLPAPVDGYGSLAGLKPLHRALCRGFISIRELQSLQDEADISAIRWSKSRRFGLTVDGRMANVPIGAEPGDRICTILGGSVPYVLRAHEDGYYSLVGECYIQGFMRGEAGIPGQTISPRRKEHYPTKHFAIK